jgi:hypothetical protein
VTFARIHHARAVTALAVLAALLFALTPGQAGAAPQNPNDNEGGSASLTAALDQASSGFVTAKAALETSQRRQAQLAVQMKATEARIGTLQSEVDKMAAGAYRGGRPSLITTEPAGTPLGDFLGRASLLDQVSWQNGQKLRALAKSRSDLQAQQRQNDTEVKTQAAKQAEMARRKGDAEKALGLTGSGNTAIVPASAARAARAAPRAADGSWPRERCSLKDPTSGLCITPRMYHAYLEARAAGFQRFTHCNRPASFGEHPLGRACDFSVTATGFGGIASGAAKTYGDRLASFFIANADRLGVLYVIWFRRIWMPSTGWQPYSSGADPSASHRNHVHLSVL